MAELCGLLCQDIKLISFDLKESKVCSANINQRQKRNTNEWRNISHYSNISQITREWAKVKDPIQWITSLCGKTLFRSAVKKKKKNVQMEVEHGPIWDHRMCLNPCAATSKIKAMLLLKDNNKPKDKQTPKAQSLKFMGVHAWWEAYLCDEDHLLCCIHHHMHHPSSVLFHSIKNALDLKTHPGTLMHEESWKTLTQGDFEQRNQLWVRQRRASLCRAYQRHCSLCVQRTGWGWHFSPQVNYGAQISPLCLPFYSQGRVHAVETLLAFHHHHSLSLTISPQFTQHCNQECWQRHIQY